MLDSAHVNGLAQLRRALKAAGPATVKELREGLLAGAEIVAGRARELAPVGTRAKPDGVPHLRDTIKAGTAGANARIYSNQIYGNPIHWGWPLHGIKPHPFIEQAIDEKQDEYAHTLDARLDAMYERLGL